MEGFAVVLFRLGYELLVLGSYVCQWGADVLHLGVVKQGGKPRRWVLSRNP